MEDLIAPAIRTEENLHLRPEEEASLVYYAFGAKKKKPAAIVPVYYRFILLPILEDYSIIVDPLSESEITFNHICINLRTILQAIDEVAGKTETGNIAENLNKLYRLIKDIAKKPTKTSVRLKKIVVDYEFISEFNMLLEQAYIGKPSGFTIHADVNEEELRGIREGVTSLLNHIEKEIALLEEAKRKLNDLYDKWKQEMDEEYKIRYGQMKESVESMKRIIEDKIGMLQSRREQEEQAVKDKYQRLMAFLKNQEQVLNDRLAEIKRRQTSIGDRKSIQQAIRNVENRIKQVEKRLKELNKELEKQLGEIEKKYNRLISSEKDRLKHAEDEINRLNRIYTSWNNMLHDGFNRILRVLDNIMTRLTSEKEEINKILVLSPHPEPLIVHLEAYIVVQDNGKQAIVFPSRITKTLREEEVALNFYPATKRYLDIRLRKVLKKVSREYLAKYDLLRTMSLDDIKNVLKKISMVSEELSVINIYLLDKI